MERAYPKILEEIEEIEDDILYPWQIAKYLKSHEDTINCAAETGKSPYAHKLGARTVIFKKAFVHFVKYGQVSSGEASNRTVEVVKTKNA